MRRTQVRTRRLILRPFMLKDYSTWFDAFVNGNAAKNRWDIQPDKAENYPKERFHELLAYQRREAATDDSYYYGIFEKKSGTYLGYLDFDIYVRGNLQFANFGYRLFNRYWGNGYGAEACRAGLKIGFQQLKLNRLEAAIHPTNKTSLKLAKKIGMRREGLKKNYWFENNQWEDHIIYVATPDDVGLKTQKPYKPKTNIAYF